MDLPPSLKNRHFPPSLYQFSFHSLLNLEGLAELPTKVSNIIAASNGQTSLTSPDIIIRMISPSLKNCLYLATKTTHLPGVPLTSSLLSPSKAPFLIPLYFPNLGPWSLFPRFPHSLFS